VQSRLALTFTFFTALAQRGIFISRQAYYLLAGFATSAHRCRNARQACAEQHHRRRFRHCAAGNYTLNRRSTIASISAYSR
jgi:hypothetical protein